MGLTAFFARPPRARVQTRDFAPIDYDRDIRLEAIMAALSGAANPFLVFGEDAMDNWPTIGLGRDTYSIGNDFWRVFQAIDEDEETFIGSPRLFDPDLVG